MQITKFGISGYKCFDKETKFDVPKTVNLIIGRNNSGKSSFLNVFERIFCGTSLQNGGQYSFYFIVEKSDLSSFEIFENKAGFTQYHPFGSVNPKVGLIGKEIKISMSSRGKFIDNSNRYSLPEVGKEYKLGLSSVETITKRNITYSPVVVLSERDVKSQPGSSTNVEPNGTGLTGSLLYHATKRVGDRELIKAVLDSVNDLLRGEEYFSSLNVLDEGNTCTIYLKNEKGEISLNDMGSGIKTIIFVSYLIEREKLHPSDSMFFFEELENNLHPEIQRRLFNKIYDFAIQYKKQVFITSHSHVAINCFYGKEDARIYHVKKDNNNSSYIETIDSDLSKSLILNDLGVKASDIFQSNGIIWVEGPSDRIYINKWLHLINPSLKEYEHYSFLYYGGKLLSHYSIDEETGVINILLTNRNSAIVMDSDIKKDGDIPNSTKLRIEKEFKDKCLFSWITEGREIENYVHKEAVDRRYESNKHEQIGKYDDFKDYIANDDSYFESHKVKTAEELSFNERDLSVMNLRDKIAALAETIEGWNK